MRTGYTARSRARTETAQKALLVYVTHGALWFARVRLRWCAGWQMEMERQTDRRCRGLWPNLGAGQTTESKTQEPAGRNWDLRCWLVAEEEDRRRRRGISHLDCPSHAFHRCSWKSWYSPIGLMYAADAKWILHRKVPYWHLNTVAVVDATHSSLK